MTQKRQSVRRLLQRATSVSYRAEWLELRRLLAVVGDFTADSLFSAADIDVLSAQIRAGTNVLAFDLNGDNVVNRNDHRVLIEQIIGTRYGDADLDGDVDAADSSRIQANFGQTNIGWAGGDFDSNNRIDFGDLALLSPNNGQVVIGGPALANNAARLGIGLDAVNAAIDDWSRLFNLTPIGGKTLPGVNDAISDVVGLVGATAGAAPSFTNPTGVVSILNSRLNALGFTLISLPGVAGQSDIAVRLLKNYTALSGSREFDDGTNPLLSGLASALNLNGSVTHSVDLAVSLMLGVDSGGFFLRGDSSLTATVRGDASVSGSYALPIATLGLNLAGTFDADYSITFTAGAPTAKIRTAQLVSNAWSRTQNGSALVDLLIELTRGGVATSLDFGGNWSIPISNSAIGPASGGISAPDVNDFVDVLLPMMTDGLESLIPDALAQRLEAIGLPFAEQTAFARSGQDGPQPPAWVKTADWLKSRGELTAPKGAPYQGAFYSRTDGTLNTRALRAARNATGKGVVIGLISNGVLAIDEAIAAGDLPPKFETLNAADLAAGKPYVKVGTFNGNTGNEGIAMMEIIHDMAPEARLVFSGVDRLGNILTDTRSDAQRWLAAANFFAEQGATIIVDDILIAGESMHREGAIAQTVKQFLATHPSITWVTSAGNYHTQVHHDALNRNGTLHVASSFKDKVAPGDYPVYQWSEGAVVKPYTKFVLPAANPDALNQTIRLELEQGHAVGSNQPADVEIWILQNPDDNATRRVALRGRFQNGLMNTVNDLLIEPHGLKPREYGLAIMVAPTAQLPAEFTLYMDGDYFGGTLGAHALRFGGKFGGGVFSHKSLDSVIAVAATDVNGLTLSPHSSRGPNRVWIPDGSGGEVLQVRTGPDFAAPQGNQVGGFGPFNTPFTGTSSASPQLGAALAVLKQLFPLATTTQLLNAIRTSAFRPNGVPMDDPGFGAGVPDVVGARERLIQAGVPEANLFVADRMPPFISNAKHGLDMLTARGFQIVDTVSTNEILSLLAGNFAGDLIKVRFQHDPNSGDGFSENFAVDFSTLGALAGATNVSGGISARFKPFADISLGLDASGFFFDRTSSIGADIIATGKVAGDLGGVGVSGRLDATLQPRISYSTLSNSKLRIGDLVNVEALAISLGTVAANATVDLSLLELDYVNNNPTISDGPHGGDPFVFRATAGLTATQQSGWDFTYNFSSIDIQNPNFNGGSYTFANFLTNLYQYGQDQLAGSGYLGEILDALENLVQPLSNGFKIGDEINEDLIALLLNASNVTVLTPTSDVQFFNDLETWLRSGGTSNFDFIKVRATITNLDLVEVLTVSGDLGQILRNANQPINLSNARLNGQMVFGIDTAGGLFVERGSTNMAVSIQVSASLSGQRLLGPFGTADFVQLDAGSNLQTTTTARVNLAGSGKLRIAEFATPISNVTTSVDNIVATLTIPGADLLPRTGSSGFNARINTLTGTAVFNGSGLDQLTLNAANTQFNLFNNELRLSSGAVTATWDPQSPATQTLLSIPTMSATFPSRPTWPTGTLSNLQMTGNAITLGALNIAGSNFIVAPVLEVRSPVFSLASVSIAISPSAVTAVGGVSVAASQVALFPNTTTPALDGIVTANNPALTLNSTGLRFTATNASFKVGALVDITATGTIPSPISFNPDAKNSARILSLPTVTASVPKLTIDGVTPSISFTQNGSTPGLALRGDGKWDVGTVGIGLASGTATFGLGALVPFEIGSFRIAFDTLPGGGANLDAFSAFLTGDVDEAVLNTRLAPIFGLGVSTNVSIQSPPLLAGKGGPESNVELRIRVDSLSGGKIGLVVNRVDVGISNAKIGILDLSGNLGIGFDSTTGLPKTISGGLGFVVGGTSKVDEISDIEAGDFDANQQGIGNPSTSGIELSDATLLFDGNVTDTSFDLQIDSTIGVRFKLADFFELYGVRFGFDLDITGSAHSGTFNPAVTGGLRSMAVRKARIKLGNFLEVTGGSNTADVATLNFTGTGNIAVFGPIDAKLPQIKGSDNVSLTGTVEGLAITRQGFPNLLPLPGITSTATIGITGLGQFFNEEDEGIFSWLPINIDSLSIRFQPQPFNDLNNDGIKQANEPYVDGPDPDTLLNESIFTINQAGDILGPGNPAAFDLGVSASIGGTIDIPGKDDPSLPFSAGVDGLVLDMLAVHEIATTGSTSRTVIKKLDGINGGIDPFALLPADQSENIPFTIGGSFGIGRTDAGAYYIYVNGEFKYQDFGGSVTLAISDRGPLLASLSMPLAVPLGPTPFLLSGARGAIEWAIGSLETPASPSDMLDNPPAVPTQIDVGNLKQVVQDKLNSLGVNEYTWDQGVAMGLGGVITLASVPDGLAGNVDLAINIGKPAGTTPGQFGIGVQVYGTGTIDALGFPLGEAGILLDFVNPIEPEVLMAIRAPAAGNPLGFLMPANAEFGIHLKTEGVMLAPVVAVREFINNMVSSAAADLDAIVARLETDRLNHAGNDRLLTTIVLDTNNDGSVSAAERAVSITRPVLLNRLIGAGTGILPTNLTTAAGFNDTALRRALRAFNGFQQEYYAIHAGGGANVVTNFLSTLANSAQLGALAALEQFNPTLSVRGKIQPVVFGFPVGDALAEATITVGKKGVGFDIAANITSLLRKIGSQNNAALETLMYAANLGLDVRGQFGFFRDFTDEWSFLVNGLLGKDPSPGSTANDLAGYLVEVLNPFDDWTVSFAGQVEFLGFPIGRVSGLFFGPESQSPATTTLLRGGPGVPAKVYVADPFGPLAIDAYKDFTRIPVSTQARIDNMAVTGGLLLTGQLLAPAIIQDPVGLINLLNSQGRWIPPTITGNIGTDIPAWTTWINGIVTGLTTSDEFARIQIFIPSPALLFDLDNLNGASPNYLNANYTSDATIDNQPGETLTLDVNNNQRWDPGDTFIDRGNGRFDKGETVDIGNGIWDPGEMITTDRNNNGIFDPPDQFDDLNRNGSRQSNEPFTDLNGNGVFDAGDAFVDVGDGIVSPGETFTDTNGNGKYDAADPFEDLNRNRVRDPNEPFDDQNRNGVYDANGEPFVDRGNGVWDGSVNNATARLPRINNPATINTALAAMGNAFFIEGYTDPKLFGLELGRGQLVLDAAKGLQFKFRANWLGENVDIDAGLGFENQDLSTMLDDLLTSPLIGGTNLSAVRNFLSTNASSLPRHVAFPVGFAEVEINSSGLAPFLSTVLKVPGSVISLPALPEASFSLGLYTPGYAKPGVDVPAVQVFGGMTMDAKLNLPGLLEDGELFFEMTLPKVDTDASLFSLSDLQNVAVNALPDFTARGSFSKFAPTLGNVSLVKVEDMVAELKKAGTVFSAKLLGELTLLPGTGEIRLTSNSQLAADLGTGGGFFGVLDFSLVKGSASLLSAVGFKIEADFDLEVNTTTTTRTVLGRPLMPATLRLFADGELQFGPFEMDGTLYLTVSPTGFFADADVSLGMGLLGKLTLDASINLPTNASISLSAGLSLTPPTNPAFALTGLIQLQFNSAGNPGVYSIKIVNPNFEIAALDIDWSLPARIEIGFNLSLGAFFFDLQTTSDLTFTLLPGVFDQSITISEFRLYADTAGNFIFGGPNPNSRATFSFSPALQLVPGQNFITLSSVGIRIVRDAPGGGQPLGRLLYDFSLFGAYDFLGITGTITSRLNSSGCFILEINPADAESDNFGVYLDLNEPLLEQFVPPGLGDPIPAFEPSNAPCTPDSLPNEPYIPPPPSVHVDIDTAFKDALGSAPYGSYTTGTEPNGTGGSRRFIRVSMPEATDTVRLRSYGYPTGANVTWVATVTVPTTLARINRATSGTDFNSSLGGTRVLTGANRNVNLTSVIDDLIWEFGEEFIVDFTFTSNNAAIPVIANATRIYYTILNDRPETEDALAYYEFNAPTTPTAGFTRLPTFTQSGVTGTTVDHSSSLTPTNRAIDLELTQNDLVAFDVGGALPTNLSFDFRFAPGTFTGDAVIAAIGATSTNFGITIVARQSTSRIVIKTGPTASPNAEYILTSAYGASNWIGFSYNGSTRVLTGFMNGSSTTGTTLATAVAFGTQQVVLGSSLATSATTTFDGVVDEVRLYAATVAGSTLIANSGSAFDPALQSSLMAYFRFDEPSTSEGFFSLDTMSTSTVLPALRGDGVARQPDTVTSPFTLTYPAQTPGSTTIGLPQVEPDFVPATTGNTLGAIVNRYAPSAATTRLHFDFEETSTTSATVNDRSHLGLNGSILGGEFPSTMTTAGAFGNAFLFDGDDYISVANSTRLPGPGDSFTVSFMLKMSNWLSQNDIVVSSNMNGVGFTIGLITSGGLSGLAVATTVGSQTNRGMYDMSGMTNNQFYHFTVEIDGATGLGAVRIGGLPRQKIASNYWFDNDAGVFTLGRRIRAASSSAFLAGTLDDFAILNGTTTGNGTLDKGLLAANGIIGVANAAKTGEYLDFDVTLDPATMLAAGQRFFVSGLRFFQRSNASSGPSSWVATISRDGSVLEGAWGAGLTTTEYDRAEIDVNTAIGCIMDHTPVTFTVRIWGLGSAGTSGLRIENLGFLGGICVPPYDAIDDSTPGARGQTVDIDVLGNDEPFGSTGFSILNPGIGTIVTGGDGRQRIRVAIPSNAVSDLVFTYIGTDGNSQDTATVTIRLAMDALNDAVSTPEDTGITFDPTGNDINPSQGGLTITGNTLPASGTLTRNGNSFTYTPALNFNGNVSFTYTVLDSRGTSDTATVTITMTPVNDAPVATNPSFTIRVGQPLSISVSSLGTDPENNALSISAVGTPSLGSRTFNSGGISYQAGSAPGTTTMSYTIADTSGAPVSGTITITILANRPPTAVISGPSTVNVDLTSLSFLNGSGSSDPDGHTLIYSWSIVAGLNFGISGTTLPSLSFNPPNGGSPNSTTFRLTVNDGFGGSHFANHTITWTGIGFTTLRAPDSPIGGAQRQDDAASPWSLPSASAREAIRINVVPVIVASPSPVNATLLPGSIANIGVGQTFFAEVWVQDLIDRVGITGGSIDLAYTTSRADAVAMNRPEFTFAPIGAINDTTGIVDDFGGGTLAGGLGISPSFVRLGYVQFTAVSAGTMNVSLASGAFEFALYGVGNVPVADVNLSGTASVNVTSGVLLPTPSLAAGQDTGVSGSDNITRFNRPIFSGTAGASGQTLELLANGAVVGSTTVGAGGAYNVQPALPLADGNHSMSVRVGATGGSSLSVTIDTIAPTASPPVFDRNLSPHRVAMNFSELLGGTLTLADVTLTNTTSGAAVATATMLLSATTAMAYSLSVPGLANARFPDGRYTLSIPAAGVTDVAGNVLASAIAFNFLFLTGDTNGDGLAGFDDLLVLAQHYGLASGAAYTQGDLNYDGAVNFVDLLLFAQVFRKSLSVDGSLAENNSLTARDRKLLDDLL